MLEQCRQTFALYPEFTAGMDVGFRLNGTLHLPFSEEEAGQLEAQVRWQRDAGLRAEQRPNGAWFFPDEGQVDNRRLLNALRKACLRAGIEIVAEPVVRLKDLDADVKVLCAGSWSGQLAKDLPVRPMRGQMLAWDAKPPPCVTFGGGGYAVPRGMYVLVGATAEEVGFDATPTQEGRAYLEGVAAKLLEDPKAVIDHWVGLRPATPDGMPLLGRLPDGVIVATGHFRNGVLLAPITARIVSALFHGETAPVDLAPFHPLRYSTTPPGRRP